MQLKRALGLLPLALLLVAWDIAVELKVYPQILLPPPIKVLKVFVEDWPTVLDNAEASSKELPAYLAAKGLYADSITPIPPSLEDVFVQLIAADVARRTAAA